ncbi:sugar nucleotide-binding protein [Candidatus Pelagibacter bacterium nBUS_44]|uniref:sugar nucleotide-binding protein n=1 Tax=Candidatus Pelagibacter bacterium nBUS_44 TaxID=3374195 RepID=UPI003EBF8A36
MKKIIITGGSGFLGNYMKIVYRKFYKDKFKCFFLSYSKKTRYSVNLSKKNSVFKILKKINPDFVINLASETNIEKCESKKKTLITQ